MSCRRRQDLQKNIEAIRQERNRIREKIQRKKDEEFNKNVKKNMEFQLEHEENLWKIIEESKNG